MAHGAHPLEGGELFAGGREVGDMALGDGAVVSGHVVAFEGEVARGQRDGDVGGERGVRWIRPFVKRVEREPVVVGGPAVAIDLSLDSAEQMRQLRALGEAMERHGMVEGFIQVVAGVRVEALVAASLAEDIEDTRALAPGHEIVGVAEDALAGELEDVAAAWRGPGEPEGCYQRLGDT